MKKILIFILSLSSTIAVAQSYMIKQLSIEQRLSNNFVVSIAQDKKGFLWFATEEGLNKFDGSHFITYYKKEGNREGLTANEINCLLDDPNDSILWIGTQSCGLNAYDYINNRFSYYLHDKNNPQSIITNDITSIRPASDGNLWITTYWDGLEYFDKKTKTFTHYNKKTVKGMSTNQLWSVCDGGNGIVYLGTVSDGFIVLDTRTRTAKTYTTNMVTNNPLLGNEIRCVYKDHNGNVWVGTGKGLDLFDAVRGEFISFAGKDKALSHSIYDIRQFDNNKLWIATEFSGVVVIDLSQLAFKSPHDVKFASIGENDDLYSLPNSSVRCVFEDSYRNVWMGVYGGGIRFLTYNMPLFDYITYHTEKQISKSLSAKSVLGLCIDHSGILWAATDGGGINLLDGENRVKVINNLRSNSVQTVMCDSKGYVWVGLFKNGAYCINPASGAMTQVFDGMKEDVRSFYEDNEHHVWICTSSGLYQSDVNTHTIKAHYSVSNNLMRTVIKDSHGRFWVGAYGGGLSVMDRKMKRLHDFFTNALPAKSKESVFPSNIINQVMEDREGRIWVATGEGLVLFDKPNNWKFSVYGMESELENTHIRSVIEDKRGNIWVSTNKGISCMIKGKHTFINYDQHDNLPMGNFNEQSVAIRKDGQLLFGANSGLCYFSPDYVLAKKTAPTVVITGLKVYNTMTSSKDSEDEISISSQSKIELDSHQNSFDVTFNVKNYALADRVDYAYMLKGLENSWYTVKGNNITFRNLPYGKYVLMVKCRMRNQQWSEKSSSLEIVVLPPFWLTWWAKSLYAIIIIVSLYFLMRFYLRKAKLEYLYASEKRSHEHEQELNDERLRFFTNITHELRTPLTLILGPLEDLMKSSDIPDKERKKISLIHQSANRLFNLISQILEFRKTETQNRQLCVERGNIVNTIYEIGLKYEELNRKSTVDISITAAEESIVIYYDKEVITIILDNLISNALKYTDSGNVHISVARITEKNNKFVEIKVADSGYGISEEARPHIFDRYYQERSEHQASGTGIGLALVKNLVVLHEGEIGVESKLGKGSTFIVRLLEDNTYPDMLHAENKEKPDVRKEPEVADDADDLISEGKPIMLVVEDNQDIREYIAESFDESYEVKTAANGKEGSVLAFEVIPDIIVSDIMMPVMDGNQMCRLLKSDIRTSHIPIILLTAKDTIADKEEGYDSGADSYLTKPFSKSLLMSRVTNLIDQRRRLYGKISEMPVDAFGEKKSIMVHSMNKLDEEFINKVNGLIIDNMESDVIDISFLSAKLNVSSSTLYRKMKGLTGLSTNEYIRKIKMKSAEELFLEGRYSISEIAYKVGINSLNYFRQCFKEEYGMIPSDYMKKLKEK